MSDPNNVVVLNLNANVGDSVTLEILNSENTKVVLSKDSDFVYKATTGKKVIFAKGKTYKLKLY